MMRQVTFGALMVGVTAFRVMALTLACVVSASAGAQTCRPPERFAPLVAARPASQMPVQGIVGSYTLALSWSPQFCRSRPGDNSEQCDGRHGRFGFVLHGLWPEGPPGGRAPRWCQPTMTIAPETVRAQFCTMPSTALMTHQWAKHGSCAARSPNDYFAAARKLFAAVRLPDMNALSRRRIDVGGFKRIMSALNPSIQPSHMVVTTDRRGDWFEEIRVCLSRDFRPQPCPRNQSRGAPDGTTLKIWRMEP
jgi:ribonuclease T2